MQAVRLRSIVEDDAAAIAGLLAGDTELALATATIPIPYALADAQKFVDAANRKTVFAITVDDSLVGLTGIMEGFEIGYWIGRNYWGRGYATAAVAALLELARKEGVCHFAAEVFPDNYASMRVLERNGFVRSGEVERNLPQSGGIRKLIRYIL